MNLSEYLRDLTNRLERLSLTEAKGHLDHPEDLIFLNGIQGAQNALNAIINTAKKPEQITIKWDGYPALIFGRNANGRFSIMDKHMFNKKDGTGRNVFSPQQFQKYDADRDVDRSQLHQVINNIWKGLEQSVSGEGYYWGDLLFSQPPMIARDGLFHFRPNPNGIQYTVDPGSDIGKELANKTAGIVVHQFIPSNAQSTDDAQSLSGTLGNLKSGGNVAILPAKMPVETTLKIDDKLVNAVNQSISEYGQDVEKLLKTAPQALSAFSQLFTIYINKRVVQRNLDNLVKGFYEYFDSRSMTKSMRKKLSQHFQENASGIIGIFSIWAALYSLKMSVVKQLNSAAESAPVQGYLQDGTRTQEGFVSQGVKLVDRIGFSAQNLAAKT